MLTPSQRRGLKMAAKLTCAFALGGAIVQVATAHAAEDAQATSVDGTKEVQSSHPVADALRLSPQSCGCVPSWGPPAPPEYDPALGALFAGGVA